MWIHTKMYVVFLKSHRLGDTKRWHFLFFTNFERFFFVWSENWYTTTFNDLTSFNHSASSMELKKRTDFKIFLMAEFLATDLV